MYDIIDINKEMLECARYGELEEIKALLSDSRILVDFEDENGCTALHKSSANGHEEIVKELLKLGANISKQNNCGNTPLHWAVTNKKLNIIKLLLGDKRHPSKGGSDVLLKNNFNRSALTEAFDIGNYEILRILLEHSSAEVLEETLNNKSDISETYEDSFSQPRIIQKIIHNLEFSRSNNLINNSIIIKCRELAIENIEKVFDNNPENDTTGIHLWSSSIVASYWIVNIIKNDNIFKNKKILELGCGCGLMGLCTAIYSRFISKQDIDKLILTDVSRIALENVRYNIELNGSLLGESAKSIYPMYMNWVDPTTWPIIKETGEKELFDIILGSDLIYDEHMAENIVFLLRSLLKLGGSFLYVHRHDRLGANILKDILENFGFKCKEMKAPIEYTKNPLSNVDQSLADNLFSELANGEFYLLEAKTI
ncbi:hypothetical protein cand_017080 [Cryptosporidium andersoni]|uniref:Uncharacterized protein n=1 Tax=Cryptosporidium andersoni TaxID=117008 RepID=A0A1J4MWV3_9CRYT|nr:hypothetical protein cand_017080 [Cryptosporidium andersoni]